MSLTDSPFDDRLNTNYVPSDSEILEIRSLLVDPADELARLDAQIEEMEITLSQLKEKRASLKAPIDAHRALISPMRHVPLDLLQEIFFSCLPTEHNALIDPTEAPLLLGRICRHWRSVSYSTPILWSSIHITSLNYDYGSSDLLSKPESVVKAWLERSATCALSVSLCDPIGHIETNFETHPIISQLPPASQRLRRLTLCADGLFLRPFLRLGAESLPLLKSIRIQTTSNMIFDDHPNSTNALQIPTLEDISLFVFERVDPLSLPLRWPQLKGLSLQCFGIRTENGFEGGLNFGAALDILRGCPNLRRCELRITNASQDPGLTPAVDTTPIILPHMHTFVLTGSLRFQKWISHLVVPKLCCLQLGDVDVGDTTCAQGQDMRVDLDLRNFTPSSFQQLLQSFLIISDLRLSSPTHYHEPSATPNDGFLTVLHDSCPVLTHLTVLPGAGFSGAAFLALIKARMTMPTPLQKVRLHIDSPLTPDIGIEPDLQPFISGGLQVDLQYAPRAWRFNPREGLYPSTSLY